MAAHYGLPTVEAVSIALHLGELHPDRIRELTVPLLAIAAAGDPVAAKLIRRQAREILAQHRAAATRLDLLRAPHAVVLGGGVLGAQHPILHRQILKGLRDQSPRAKVGVLQNPPAVGAALLALDALGPARQAEATVRREVAAAERSGALSKH